MENKKMTGEDLMIFLYDVQSLQSREYTDEKIQELSYRALLIRETMVPNGMEDWRNIGKPLDSILLPD